MARVETVVVPKPEFDFMVATLKATRVNDRTQFSRTLAVAGALAQENEQLKAKLEAVREWAEGWVDNKPCCRNRVNEVLAIINRGTNE